jgi:hypothetical protein
MTDQTKDAHAASHALSPPSEELGLAPKRAAGWLCSKCGAVDACEGALSGDNWCCSCAACGTMQPLYDQAALDADVAAERERWDMLLSAARKIAESNAKRADDCGMLSRALLDALHVLRA